MSIILLVVDRLHEFQIGAAADKQGSHVKDRGGWWSAQAAPPQNTIEGTN